MSADTEHDEPLWSLRSVLIALRVSELLPVLRASFLDLVRGAVTDEHGLATPFDDDVLALRNVRELNFDLGKREDVGRGAHGPQELGHSGFGDAGGKETHSADHEVRNRTVRGQVRLVRGEVGSLRRIFHDWLGSMKETLGVVTGRRGWKVGFVSEPFSTE